MQYVHTVHAVHALGNSSPRGELASRLVQYESGVLVCSLCTQFTLWVIHRLAASWRRGLCSMRVGCLCAVCALWARRSRVEHPSPRGELAFVHGKLELFMENLNNVMYSILLQQQGLCTALCGPHRSTRTRKFFSHFIITGKRTVVCSIFDVTASCTHWCQQVALGK